MKSFYALIFLFILFLTAGCKHPCEDYTLQRRYDTIPQELQNLVPYQREPGEKLKFQWISGQSSGISDTDTVYLTGLGREVEYEADLLVNECGHDTGLYQTIRYIFFDRKGKKRIEVEQKVTTYGGFNFHVIIDTFWYAISTSKLNKQDKYYRGTWDTNNVSYPEVASFKQRAGSNYREGRTYGGRMVYSLKEGIVKLTFFDKDLEIFLLK